MSETFITCPRRDENPERSDHPTPYVYRRFFAFEGTADHWLRPLIIFKTPIR
jgi:hypothetical protein